ncbi:hypothetical protein GCM10010193_42690 [Kitasatospora atroaurantiaca]|uniref:Uncharacterized protein DUF4229 n=1 Tax=Kitasatospora atroaurantiaca TaxID=285545 RepID=A0A561ETX5_9ACTN|nr:DUF4229 domain-containing protein [Kitasatospora atroaurantiaca]TWE19060.1 uncharacterized protein DUF4229 [Kitasatospora atroaurantiaca]
MSSKPSSTSTTPATSATVDSTSHATLRYTSLRASIFLGCLLVALLLGHFGIIPVAGAAGFVFLILVAGLVSAPLSYVLLSKQRDAMSAQIAGKVGGMRSRTADRIANQNAEEDAADDAARAAAAPQN